MTGQFRSALYPCSLIKPTMSGNYWVTFYKDAGAELAEALVWGARDANRIARQWERDYAEGKPFTCPECFGAGVVDCEYCRGSGKAVFDITWEGDQKIRECKKTQTCGRCLGEGVESWPPPPSPTNEGGDKHGS